MAVGLQEASETYQHAMRNIPAGQDDLCPVCHTFYDADYGRCISCNRQPALLDLVAPISYSEHGGQLHLALHHYKRTANPVQTRTYMTVRLKAILWRYLDSHEDCLASAVGVAGFDVVTIVPSSHPGDGDRATALDAIVKTLPPVADRHETLLTFTGAVAADDRSFDRDRYTATRQLDGANVLLVDDTWTGGGHAQSAAATLASAGAHRVVLVVIGRHLRRNWHPVMGEDRTAGDLFDDLPVPFSWETCVAHE